MSCINVVRKIHEQGLRVKLRNVVHDSLIVTCHKDEAIAVCELVVGTMEECQSWIVPTKAEPEIGTCWADMLSLDSLKKFAMWVNTGCDDASIAHLMELCKPQEFNADTCSHHRKMCKAIGLL
jgi:hypothetical protein